QRPTGARATHAARFVAEQRGIAGEQRDRLAQHPRHVQATQGSHELGDRRSADQELQREQANRRLCQHGEPQPQPVRLKKGQTGCGEQEGRAQRPARKQRSQRHARKLRQREQRRQQAQSPPGALGGQRAQTQNQSQGQAELEPSWGAMHGAHPDDSATTARASASRPFRGTSARAKTQHRPNNASVPKQAASPVANTPETMPGTPYCDRGASDGDVLECRPNACVTRERPSGAASASGASNAAIAIDKPRPASTALLRGRAPSSTWPAFSSNSGRKRSTLATTSELMTASPTPISAWTPSIAGSTTDSRAAPESESCPAQLNAPAMVAHQPAKATDATRRIGLGAAPHSKR